MAYDIEGAFNRIENELIQSMIRNMKKHRLDEIDEEKQWVQWQALQLQALNEYRLNNKKTFGKRFKHINKEIEYAIEQAYADGQTDEEAKILEQILAAKKKPSLLKDEIGSEFFHFNESKMNALIKATMADMQKAEYAALRRANDRYRQIIFDAQVYAVSGAGTYEKAVDMAAHDFIKRGIDCIEYGDGSRHTLKEYAMMAIRTASKRTYLMGQAEKREEWGIHTVIVNKRTNPCPKCAKWIGKILIDDVYGTGKRSEGDYPLLSTAIRAGFLHPNCKDAYTTYFPGITPKEDKVTRAEFNEMAADYVGDQQLRIAQNNADKFQRLADNSLDEENQRKYSLRSDGWKSRLFRNDPNRSVINMPFGAFKNGLDFNGIPIEEYHADEVLLEQMKQRFELVGQDIKKVVENTVGKQSAWKDEIRMNDSLLKDGALGRKDETCFIELTSLSGDDDLLHEILHSVSASLFTQEEYEQNWKIEEGTVQLLSEEICKSKGVAFSKAYEKRVNALRSINEKFDFGSNLEFAAELLKEDMPDRYNYLVNKVFDRLKVTGVTRLELIEIETWLDALRV